MADRTMRANRKFGRSAGDGPGRKAALGVGDGPGPKGAPAAGDGPGPKAACASGPAAIPRLPAPRWGALIVLIASFALYANTLGHGFVWDDITLIANNPAMRTFDASTLPTIFTQGFARVEGHGTAYYRPLATLSYQLDFILFHGNPAGFHWSSVLLNAITCVLVFAFVRLLFGNVVLAMATAMLFAAHPVHTESVAWISGRTDVLATLWSLVSLSCYVLARRRGSYLLLSASLVAFLLALFAKESAACLPLLVLLFEFGPLATLLTPRFRSPQVIEGAPAKRSIVTAILHPALFLGVLGGYLLLRRAAIGTITSTHEGFASGTLGHVALPLSILAGYVYKVLLPITLNAEYDAPVPVSLADAPVLAGLAVTLLIVAGVWRWRRRPDVVLGAGIFVLGLLPVMNVVPIGEVSAERFLYFPSLGMALILGGIFTSVLAGKHRVSPGREAPGPDSAMAPGADSVTAPGPGRVSSALTQCAVLMLAVVLVVFAGRTVARNRDWKNEEILFAKTAEQDPRNPRPHAALADAASRKGDISTAAREYRKTLELDPGDPVGLTGLAQILAREGKYDEALPLLERAVRASPDDPKLNGNIGFLYYKTNRYEQAVPHLEAAIRVNPDEPWAHFNLGSILLQQGKLADARAHFERVTGGGGGLGVANYYLAQIEKADGNAERAKRYARTFLATYAKDDRLRSEAEAIVRGDR